MDAPIEYYAALIKHFETQSDDSMIQSIDERGYVVCGLVKNLTEDGDPYFQVSYRNYICTYTDIADAVRAFVCNSGKHVSALKADEFEKGFTFYKCAHDVEYHCSKECASCTDIVCEIHEVPMHTAFQFVRNELVCERCRDFKNCHRCANCGTDTCVGLSIKYLYELWYHSIEAFHYAAKASESMDM